MSQASVGLLALWTGQLTANVEHIKDMAIHQMNDAELDKFAKFVKEAGYALSSINKYVQDIQEQA